ncbi:MAG: hypothetical protein MZV63_59515 [Marinilabiliales bacterium]|nr:hypothetical protein [Marinilabiliales bacterium]
MKTRQSHPEIADLREKIDALTAKIEDEKTAIEVLLEKELFLKSNYDVVTKQIDHHS